jgi:hypothetical protein
MTPRDIAEDGLPTRFVFRHMPAIPPRQTTVFERIVDVARDLVGMGVFIAMLVACAALIVVSR